MTTRQPTPPRRRDRPGRRARTHRGLRRLRHLAGPHGPVPDLLAPQPHAHRRPTPRRHPRRLHQDLELARPHHHQGRTRHRDHRPPALLGRPRRHPHPPTHQRRLAPRVRRRKVAFGTGYVFDITQTQGDPLDDGPAAPARAPEDLAAHLFGHCHTHGVAVEYRDGMPPGLSGYWRPATDTITLNAADTHGDQVATLAHELAHRHDPQLRDALDAPRPPLLPPPPWRLRSRRRSHRPHHRRPLRVRPHRHLRPLHRHLGRRRPDTAGRPRRPRRPHRRRPLPTPQPHHPGRRQHRPDGPRPSRRVKSRSNLSTWRRRWPATAPGPCHVRSPGPPAPATPPAPAPAAHRPAARRRVVR